MKTTSKLTFAPKPCKLQFGPMPKRRPVTDDRNFVTRVVDSIINLIMKGE